MTPPAPRHVAVIDIGKTNAKLALVRLPDLAEVAVRRRPNAVLPGPPYPHFDADALWDFIRDGLRELNLAAPVDAIVVTTHGSAAALVGADGRLAMPVLDYEHDGPAELAAEYDALRPGFAETGSPRLSRGLNLGAQLHWQARAFPDAFARVARILTWPQYWSFRLSGVAACDYCSLGAHSDLWNPGARTFSSLVDRLHLRARFPRVAAPGEVLGPILPELAAALGLDPATPVLAGIHDSNASLLPHLVARTPPFAVVSTGTWVVTMAVGADGRELDPERGALVNVSAHGDPVPSATFMGGREFAELVPEGAAPSDRALGEVLAARVMLLPGTTPGTGPFPRARGGWTTDPATLGPDGVLAAVSLYLALMTRTSLDMLGAGGPVLVEGPFARSPLFLRALAALTMRPVLPQTATTTGTSGGAALLAMPQRPPPAAEADPGPAADPRAEAIRAYGSTWEEAAAWA
jgi:sugar (pentulose or hexulose) kinase